MGMEGFGDALESAFKALSIVIIVLFSTALFFGWKGCGAYDRGYEDGVRDAVLGKVKVEQRVDTTTVILKP